MEDQDQIVDWLDHKIASGRGVTISRNRFTNVLGYIANPDPNQWDILYDHRKIEAT